MSVRQPEKWEKYEKKIVIKATEKRCIAPRDGGGPGRKKKLWVIASSSTTLILGVLRMKLI